MRHRLFPVTRERIFLAHAGVAPLPGPTVDALKYEAERASIAQESHDYLAEIEAIRRVAARLINATNNERHMDIALEIAGPAIGASMDEKAMALSEAFLMLQRTPLSFPSAAA